MSNQPPTTDNDDLEGAECFDCHFHEEKHTSATNIAVIHVMNPDDPEDVMEFGVPVCNTHALTYRPETLEYDITCTGEPIPLSCMNPTATAQKEVVE